LADRASSLTVLSRRPGALRDRRPTVYEADQQQILTADQSWLHRDLEEAKLAFVVRPASGNDYSGFP
jgi:hypothetical protein